MIQAFKMKVELQDVEPKVWRSFIIPADTTFKRLHDTLQTVMGWQDAHMYEFSSEVGDNEETLEIVCDEEIFDEFQWRKENYLARIEAGETLHKFDLRWYDNAKQKQMKKAWTYKLTSYFKNPGDTITYRYDFGDDWHHTITLESIVEGYPVGYPMLLEAEGNCPPEDVGGSGGFDYFLEAWNHPEHPEHEEMRAWGEGQYVEFNSEQVNFMLSQTLLLKRVK